MVERGDSCDRNQVEVTTMKRYWDLSEKERAALTDTDVEALLSIELMERGVLRVEPPTPEPVPEVPPPKLEVWQVVISQWNHAPIVFDAAEQAFAFLKLSPMEAKSVYLGSGSVENAEPYPASASVAKVLMYSAAEIAQHRTVLALAAAASDRNQKAESEYQEALAREQKETSALRDDWRECQRKALNVRKVLGTFDEYKRLAGNEWTASAFLVKAFDRGTIARAEEWSGVRMLDVSAPPTDVEAVGK
jgi:hypothetical protein